MTELAPFPSAPVEIVDFALPPKPDLFALPPALPPLVLTIEGAEYHIPAEHLAQYLRFSSEQLEAVDAMRAAGVAESVIEQAFPPSRILPAAETAGSIPAIAPAAAPGSSPPVAPAVPFDPVAEQRKIWAKCPIGHNKTMMDDNGRIVCIRCGFVLLGRTGFIDNRNPGWNGMSRVGAVDPRAGVPVFTPGSDAGKRGVDLYRGDSRV